VFDGMHREVKAVVDTEDGYGAAEIRLVDGDSEISLDSGKLAGLKDARDNILTSFLGQLDDLAATLISEFNQIHSSGQGLSGYTQVLSEFDVESESTALDQLGLPFTPVNGSFQVQVLNTQTGLTETTDILVPLNGDDDDVTLNGLAAALDAVDGLSASVTPQRKLEIKADSPVVEFAFADDTSGVLAALGIGTFFSGSTAGDISVNAAVRTDPGKFAASQGGIGADTENGLELAGFFDRSLESKNGDSLAILYDRLTGDTTQAAAVSRAVAEGFRVFQQTLEGQHLAISGVNLDEETVRLIQFQRAYQANAKFISTAADLLETLINL